MSSVYRPAPATSRGSSRLRIEPPMAERTAMARIIRWPRYLHAVTERAKRWGVLPSYWSYQGQLVETSTDTEAAILQAMGASGERPPAVRRHSMPPGPCSAAPNRAWGWAVQLYAVRSKDSWGIGDMGDLRRFARWSRSQGASALLLNPLGAQNPTLPYQPSPYYSSSRRFRNTLYLRVDDVDGAERCAAELLPLRAEAQTLNERRLIDYDEVFRLKTRALAAIFKAAPEPRGIEAWAKGKGRALRDFATYNALAEELGPAHYEPFIEAVRSAAVHAAGIRLDHVMGLFRLFWIPSGSPPGGGAYVRYPAPDMLALLALESRRAKAYVIGEDLGLVEPAV